MICDASEAARARRAWILAATVAMLAAVPVAAAAQTREFGPPYLATGGFLDPTAVAVDVANGRIVVADTGHHQLRHAAIDDLVGTPSWIDAGLADPLSPVALNLPQGVAADGFGNLYAVDAVSGAVQRYQWNAATQTYVIDSAFGALVGTVADGLPICGPRDIAVGADGRVYVLDSGNRRVVVASGAYATGWDVHAQSAQWSNPYGLDVGPDGTVYIADTGNHVVRRISTDGTEVIYGGYGTANGQFRAPRDVALAPDGRLFVADTQNHRVTILRADGSFALQLAEAPLVAAPQKVVVDGSGRVFVVDSDYARVVAYLGATVPPPYDLYVRDYFGDTGAQPFTGAVLFSPDILVRAQPDVDPADAGARGLEAYLFDPPRPGHDSYAYVAIRNRGSQPASNAVVRFYWADPSGAMVFPADWHSEGFSVPNVGGGAPTPGNALPVPTVSSRAGGVDGVQIVGPIVWRPPEALRDRRYVLLVRVLSPYDPLVAASGMADVKANNAVALRPVGTSDEALDGSFSLDLSGDVYVQLISSKAGYANYLAFEDPATAMTCPGVGLPNCYFETRKCRTACPQVDGDFTCACFTNEARSVGHYAAGQRFAAKLLVDKDRNGTIERTYYADPTRNWDSFDHVRTYHVFQGTWILEFEDFDNGGDRDFNDLVVMVRVIPDAVSPDAAQLPVPSLYLLSNVVVEEATKVPDPKIRLTVLLQNSDTSQAQQTAVCPMLHFSEAREPSEVYTYRDNENGTPGDGTPDHVGVGDERISVRLSRDQRWTNAPPHPAPRAGDLFTVPPATATGPGEVAVAYEIPISKIDALITDPANKLGGLGADVLQQRIAANGLAMDLLTGVTPAALVCPNGPMTSFDGQAGQVASVQTTWTDPNTYRIASPAFIDVPTVNFRTRDPTSPPLFAQIEYYWSDNLPEHLKGHIRSTIPPRTPFWAGGTAVTKVPVRLDFADDLPEGFQGKLEAFVREVYTGSVIVTATRNFSKDNRPPTVSAVHSTRTPATLDVAVTAADPTGLREAWLAVDVGGARRPDLDLARVSGDFRSATEFSASVGSLAPLDPVTVDLSVEDRAGLATEPLRLPVANLGNPSFECNAIGLNAIVLDGTRSTGPADMVWEWSGPFGTATGPSPVVWVPIGSYPISLTVSDGRGFTGTEGATLSVDDTTPPSVGATATPACLWPPNHKHVPFRIGENLSVQVQDACDPAPRYRVVSVASDEPDDGLADGDTARDVLFGDDGFCVRAERGAGGRGRTYSVVVEAVDASGNRAAHAIEIRVPHDASDVHCPFLPSSVFADDGDQRCSFGAVTLSATSFTPEVVNDSNGEHLHVEATRGSGCTTGVGGSGFLGLLLALLAAQRRSRERRPISRVRTGSALVLLITAGIGRAGDFTVTGSMAAAREGHTATLLQDGRVLVAGGRDDTELTSAEIFDPALGTWSLAGELASARRGHTATLLPDGRVVVIGGSAAGPYSSRVYPSTAEIFGLDGQWTVTGSLATPRASHTATLLDDGRVLVVGGYNLGDLDSCEIFDPGDGTFKPTGALATRRYGHEAVRLADGRVLVLGGASSSASGTNFTNTAEVWSPSTESWSAAPPLLASRYSFAAALGGGRVLVVGGSNDQGVLAEAESYDPSSGSASLPPLAEARTSAAAVAVNGGIVVIGGYDLSEYGAQTVHANAEGLDASSLRWFAVGPMNAARSAATATMLASGDVLVAGGWSGTAALASAEIVPAAALARTEAPGGGCGCGTASGGAVAVVGLLALGIPLRRWAPRRRLLSSLSAKT